ncbi:MAG: hypothetical protein IKT68_07930 [Clostridia bacterium]|nr:hypothetical protein [Clostridia bacterium]
MVWTTKTKCCATCANWSGDRKVNIHGSAETSGPNAHGSCYIGAKSNPNAAHGTTCNKYQKWPAVK